MFFLKRFLIPAFVEGFLCCIKSEKFVYYVGYTLEIYIKFGDIFNDRLTLCTCKYKERLPKSLRVGT